MPRGRNKHLIEQRNSALIRRYYYWTEVQRLRFLKSANRVSRRHSWLFSAANSGYFPSFI